MYQEKISESFKEKIVSLFSPAFQFRVRSLVATLFLEFLGLFFFKKRREYFKPSPCSSRKLCSAHFSCAEREKKEKKFIFSQLRS